MMLPTGRNWSRWNRRRIRPSFDLLSRWRRGGCRFCWRSYLSVLGTRFLFFSLLSHKDKIDKVVGLLAIQGSLPIAFAYVCCPIDHLSVCQSSERCELCSISSLWEWIGLVFDDPVHENISLPFCILDGDRLSVSVGRRSLRSGDGTNAGLTKFQLSLEDAEVVVHHGIGQGVGSSPDDDILERQLFLHLFHGR